MTGASTPPSWRALLETAVAAPGLMLAAYSAFPSYSVGNQLLAWQQCASRSLLPGPINTYRGWHTLGRHVRQGERALTLCLPLPTRGKRALEAVEEERPDLEHKAEVLMRFVFRAKWFVLSQTEGEPYRLPPMPSWDKSEALRTLGITEGPFLLLDGNTQGYAVDRTIAINPVAAFPHKTLFHELAHIVLGPTHVGDEVDGLPRYLEEVEAEGVAFLLLDVLQLSGGAFARGYVQHWLRDRELPERSAQRMLKAVDRILKAGTPTPAASAAA
jgi:antirestriction protein ArdC